MESGEKILLGDLEKEVADSWAEALEGWVVVDSSGEMPEAVRVGT